jgi:hypothetical protein
MSIYDKNLKLFLKHHGYKLDKSDSKNILILLKSIVKQIVFNIFKNITSVLSSTPNESVIYEKHITITKNVCNNCASKYLESVKQSGGGGTGTYLPSDYFTGVDHPSYNPNLISQDINIATDTLARPALYQNFSSSLIGGSGPDHSNLLYDLVVKICIPDFFEKNNVYFGISKCAMNLIMKSVNDNLLILLLKYNETYCHMNKSCVLSYDDLIKLVLSETFLFLHIN